MICQDRLRTNARKLSDKKGVSHLPVLADWRAGGGRRRWAVVLGVDVRRKQRVPPAQTDFFI